MKILTSTAVIATCLIATLAFAGSVSPEVLAKYSNDFEQERNGYWDDLPVAQTDEQFENFRHAERTYRNGKLNIATIPGKFSKADQDTTFTLVGDFDVQIDVTTHFPRRSKNDYDIFFSAVPRFDGMDNLTDYASVLMSMGKGKKTVWLTALVLKDRELTAFKNGEGVKNLDGSMRIVRTGAEVECMYRKSRNGKWTSLGPHPFTTEPVMIGYGVQNYRSVNFTTKGIPADQVLSAEFDNLIINAADGIEESDI